MKSTEEKHTVEDEIFAFFANQGYWISAVEDLPENAGRVEYELSSARWNSAIPDDEERRVRVTFQGEITEWVRGNRSSYYGWYSTEWTRRMEELYREWRETGKMKS